MGSVARRTGIAWIETCCYPGCQAARWEEPDSPPFCAKHMIECAHYIARYMAGLNLIDPNREAQASFAPETVDRVIVGAPTPSVVYYVRIGDHVKIGTTINLGQRLKGLYLDTNPAALLATEPGDASLERQRHVQFAAERVYANRELFNPSPRLLAHIEAIKAQAA